MAAKRQRELTAAEVESTVSNGDIDTERPNHVHSQPLSLTQLPPAFRVWLTQNDIDPRIYTESHKLPRYIRLNPRSISGQSASDLATEMGLQLTPVNWLPRMSTATEHMWWSVDSQHTIADTEAYKCGKIYGMDASSAAAVIALGCRPGDHVLDLCCAPGAKLCFMADQLWLDSTKLSHELEPSELGSITGVDISAERLNVARKLLKKYGLLSRPVTAAAQNRSGHSGEQLKNLPQIRLLLADGLAFAAPPPQVNVDLGPTCKDATQDSHTNGQVDFGTGRYVDVTWSSGVAIRSNTWRARKLRKKHRQRRNIASHAVDGDKSDASAPWSCYTGSGERSRNHAAVVSECGDSNQCNPSVAGVGSWYDRVLVDAQCTHDGSMKHITKYATQWGWDSFSKRVLGTATTTLDDSSLHPETHRNRIQDGTNVQDTQRGLLRQGFKMLRSVAPTPAVQQTIRVLRDAAEQNLCTEGPQSVEKETDDDMVAEAAAQTEAWPCLVYATCSMSVVQNEAVVQWLLDVEPSATLIPIWIPQPCSADGSSAACWRSATSIWPCRAGRGKLSAYSVRFDPLCSETSGLFVCKLVKICS